MEPHAPSEPFSGSLDAQVLAELARGGGHRAFNGLRRRLEAHPESLVRTLRRLERLGEIGHDRHGYFRRTGPAPGEAPAYSVPLATVQLPTPLSPPEVLGALAGRWFGELRWVGTFDLRRPPALVWSIPGVEGQLVLQVRGDRLKLSAEGPKDRFPADALAAAGEELLWNVLGRLRGRSLPRDAAPAPGTVALSRDTAPDPSSAPGWGS